MPTSPGDSELPMGNRQWAQSRMDALEDAETTDPITGTPMVVRGRQAGTQGALRADAIDVGAGGLWGIQVSSEVLDRYTEQLDVYMRQQFASLKDVSVQAADNMRAMAKHAVLGELGPEKYVPLTLREGDEDVTCKHGMTSSLWCGQCKEEKAVSDSNEGFDRKQAEAVYRNQDKPEPFSALVAPPQLRNELVKQGILTVEQLYVGYSDMSYRTASADVVLRLPCITGRALNDARLLFTSWANYWFGVRFDISKYKPWPSKSPEASYVQLPASGGNGNYIETMLVHLERFTAGDDWSRGSSGQCPHECHSISGYRKRDVDAAANVLAQQHKDARQGWGFTAASPCPDTGGFTGLRLIGGTLTEAGKKREFFHPRRYERSEGLPASMIVSGRGHAIPPARNMTPRRPHNHKISLVNQIAATASAMPLQDPAHVRMMIESAVQDWSNRNGR